MENQEPNVKEIKPRNRRIMGGGGPDDEGDEIESRNWPEWVGCLLSVEFFGQCKAHVDYHKSECNMFCLDCSSARAFCSACLPLHATHQHIQIRRSSYHDVVRVSEIQKYMEVGGVQTYIINSARIVFLNQRPQPRHGKGVTNTCLVCHRTLLDNFSFCSLGCKIVGVSKNFPGKNMKLMNVIDSEESINEGLGRFECAKSFTPETPPPTSGSFRRGKKRKGIPHRAPMGGFITEYW